MSGCHPLVQSVAQAGWSGEPASVGFAVGVLRSSHEVPVMGMERRRDAGLDGRSGRGRRLRKEISLYDEKSPTLSVVALVNGEMEPDSESRKTARRDLCGGAGQPASLPRSQASAL